MRIEESARNSNKEFNDEKTGRHVLEETFLTFKSHDIQTSIEYFKYSAANKHKNSP